MARTRSRYRGGSSVSTDGSVNGIIEPPPFPVRDFIYKWKNWLNNLYNAISLDVATNWYNIVAVSASDTPYSITIVDQVVLADPDTGALVLNLPEELEDGISFFIKNIDESGTYSLTVNPGTNLIEQASGVPTTADITIPILDSRHVIYDSNLSTWWII